MNKSRLLAPLCLVLSLCVSCRTAKTIEVEKPVYLHDTITNTLVQHDSTYVDRWHTIFTQGDTVYSSVTEYVYRERLIHDTLFQRTETPVETIKTIEVARPLTAWQKVRITAGNLLFALIFLVIILALAYLHARRKAK